MGMDVYGTNPKKEIGEYFRNNIVSWNPLWDTIYEISGNIITKEQEEAGHYNEHSKISQKQTKQIVKKIELFLFNNWTEEDLCNRDIKTHVKSKLEYFYKKFQDLDRYPSIVATAKQYKLNISIQNLDDFVNNFMKFYVFLRNCGGFKIC